ncbi:MAG: pyridoxamine 5'-phosphate oxidase [Bacteroidota bacterium]|nr:pyridoxamine 5'-phosphate oxidase [Bacteroidota bacterium]
MTHNQDIKALRKNYSSAQLNENGVNENPIVQFRSWFHQAMKAELQEPNAMCLSTCNDNIPDSRIVLLKSIEDDGFVFFTNYGSNKGQQIASNPNVSLNFVWLELERQVRIQGVAEKISQAESEAYFYSRPFESQIGAIISAQSQYLENREMLEIAMQNALEKYKTEKPQIPEHWGGYIVKPLAIEFWQGRSNRLHDRLQYYLQNGIWNLKRLYP